jgi:hypothetical protein
LQSPAFSRQFIVEHVTLVDKELADLRALMKST